MKDNFVYPAKIKKTENEYEIYFLDFPEAVTASEEEKDIVTNAQELLALTIIDYQEQGKKLPMPSVCEEGVVYIQVWLPYYKNIAKEIYVKKTVTIPQWLDILAKENKVNFSAALVSGIKEQLGLPAERK